MTSGFLEIQNDFGFTPLVAAKEKAKLYKETLQSSELSPEQIETYEKKLESCTKCVDLLENFDSFITESRWNS